MGNNMYKVNDVVVDLSFYTGNDSYSDGNIEVEILSALKENKAEELLHNDNRWPILYHLSKQRQNLLDGFTLKDNSKVLEIGCGCGAITGILCQKAESVTAVEISPRRAEIAAYNNKDKDNLTIYVGNLNDMKFPDKFDYITLIGVLEYAGSFTHTSEPWKDFLVSCKRFLKPDGQLVIAIENKLGLKYWSGAREDHTGGYFDGIEGYKTDSVRTFSRKELKELLSAAGLDKIQWFYPHPDYKLPIDVYSDNSLPTIQQLKEVVNWSYDHNRIELFSEGSALVTMLEAGLYHEFANSFLVFASREEIEENKINTSYIHHSFLRKKEYSVVTSICDSIKGKTVIKEALDDLGRIHLKRLEENCRILSDIYGAEHVVQCKLISDSILEMEYINGDSFNDLAINAMYEDGVEGLSKYINFYCENILRGTVDRLDNINFDLTSPNRKYNFDIHFGNIIVSNGRYVIFDYEWLASDVPAKYILYRVLKLLYLDNINDMKKFGIDLDLLLRAIDIDEITMEKYNQWEMLFFDMVLERYFYNYRKDTKKINLNELNIR